MAVMPEPTEPIRTLGILELSSIAKGLLVCDRMLKKADIKILRAIPVGSGKFTIFLTGDEANLFEAVQEGRSVGAPFITGWTYLPNIHSQVVDALARRGAKDFSLGTVGILETTSLASSIQAADAAAKTAGVHIIELTFELDLGGKSYFTLTGELAEVEAAMEAAERQLLADGTLVHREILAWPHEGMGAIVRKEKPCC